LENLRLCWILVAVGVLQKHEVLVVGLGHEALVVELELGEVLVVGLGHEALVVGLELEEVLVVGLGHEALVVELVLEEVLVVGLGHEALVVELEHGVLAVHGEEVFLVVALSVHMRIHHHHWSQEVLGFWAFGVYEVLVDGLGQEVLCVGLGYEVLVVDDGSKEVQGVYGVLGRGDEVLVWENGVLVE
jgi:hypothetical protein